MEKFIYKGKTALITGASTGIGAVFARELAGRGMNVVLVARSEEKLKVLAGEINRKNGVKAEVIAADLSQPGVAARLYQETRQRDLKIDLLVNNAGFSTYGAFETIDPSKEQQEIAVNIATLVDLTHAFVPDMLERRNGAVINVASIGSFISSPRQAVYSASKAFVLSFGEALHAEFRDRGVNVFTLCPGVTITEFFDEIKVQLPRGAQTPEQVVTGGLRAFDKGRHLFISGLSNKGLPLLVRLLPRTVTLRLVDRVSRNVMRPDPATTR